MAFPVPTVRRFPPPLPTEDQSGGILVMAAQRGQESHRMQFHVRPFNPATRVNDHVVVHATGLAGFLGIEADVPVTADIPYTSAPSTTGTDQQVEETVGDTIYNLGVVLSAFWNNDWVFRPVSLSVFATDPGYDAGNPTREHPYPRKLLRVHPMPRVRTAGMPFIAAVQQGRNGDASTSPASMINVNMQVPTTLEGGVTPIGPGRFRCTLLDSQEWDHSGVPSEIEGTYGDGATDLTRLVGYIAASANCPVASAIVARQGVRLGNWARITNRMYQRSYRTVLRNSN